MGAESYPHKSEKLQSRTPSYAWGRLEVGYHCNTSQHQEVTARAFSLPKSSCNRSLYQLRTVSCEAHCVRYAETGNTYGLSGMHLQTLYWIKSWWGSYWWFQPLFLTTRTCNHFALRSCSASARTNLACFIQSWKRSENKWLHTYGTDLHRKKISSGTNALLSDWKHRCVSDIVSQNCGLYVKPSV